MLTSPIFTPRALPAPVLALLAALLNAPLALLLAVAVIASDAQAAFAIRGTRVIYDESQGEASVQISHATGQNPALMQTWIDDGDPHSQPGQQSVPFILTPAVALLKPGATQVVRVLRIGELPSDKESLFFFNVLEVPPDASDRRAAGESFVQFAMQARLKFFYRPRGLQPAIGRAPDLLRFSTATGADGKFAVRITNPTPYHITFTELALHASDADEAPMLAELDTRAELAPMIAPFSEETVVMKAVGGGEGTQGAQVRVTAQSRLRATLINDQGGRNTKVVKLD